MSVATICACAVRGGSPRALEKLVVAMPPSIAMPSSSTPDGMAVS
jgi:hypothetical protein